MAYPLTGLNEKYLDTWAKLSDDAKFALDIAVMESMYIDADRHRAEINDAAQAVLDTEVKKIYRAASKTMLAKHRKGEHDQKEHGNWAKQAQSFVREALTGRQSEQLALFGPDTPVGEADGENKILAALGGLPERVTSATEKVSEGMREFFSGSTWGERLLAGADFLARGTNAVAEAAKVLVTYGPFVGARMIAAYFRYGGYDVPLEEAGTTGGPPKRTDKTSNDENQDRARNWAINKLLKNQPDEETMVLSNGKAPSEGFIIGRDGTVIAHAVGRGSDHFLPFGLRHLRMLRKDEGGEMVRRRALGGVTTEDIKAAMMLGADKVTVVSNSGVFTMDLTDRAKGMTAEHLQVLSRFDSLLRRESSGSQSGAWNFTTYDRSMRALALEFPLHFETKDNKPGSNPRMGDRNHPTMTIVEEIRRLFDPESRSGRGGGGGRGSWWDAAPPGFTPRKDETREDFEDRLLQRNRMQPSLGLWSKYQGNLNPKNEPDDTTQRARVIYRGGDPSTQWSGRSRVTSAEDAVNTFGNAGTKDVRAAQMSDDRLEDEQKRMRQIQARNARLQEEVKRRSSGSRLAEDVENTNNADDDDPAYKYLESQGVDPDTGLDARESRDRRYMFDMFDEADDYSPYPTDND